MEVFVTDAGFTEMSNTHQSDQIKYRVLAYTRLLGVSYPPDADRSFDIWLDIRACDFTESKTERRS